MHNAASFDLLKFVKYKPILNAKKMIGVIILCAAILFGYFLFQINSLSYDRSEESKEALTIKQLISRLQPLMQQGVNNPIVGVLFSNKPESEQGFYPEFEALTHIQIDGLWLEDVEIHRYPAFIKITGSMDAPEKLKQLLAQLESQSALKGISFVGFDVRKGSLPDVPDQYREEVKQLKIPSFYHFVIQTTPLKQPGESV